MIKLGGKRKAVGAKLYKDAFGILLSVACVLRKVRCMPTLRKTKYSANAEVLLQMPVIERYLDQKAGPSEIFVYV